MSIAQLKSTSHDSPTGPAAAPQGQPTNAQSGEHRVSESGEFPRVTKSEHPRVAAILETAASCFSRGGFTATTLADIGKELGLRKSIVHYYFASKGALVHEVQRLAQARHHQIVRQAVGAGQDEGPARRLAEVFRPLWPRLAESPDVRGLLIELWGEGRRDADLSRMAAASSEDVHRLLVDKIRQSGPSRVAPEDLATLTLSILDGLTVLAERGDNQQRAERAFEAFLTLLDCSQSA
jgi:AcrR family transcriptional regulator